jgi:rhodanese-related sulfurtransferase
LRYRLKIAFLFLHKTLVVVVLIIVIIYALFAQDDYPLYNPDNDATYAPDSDASYVPKHKESEISQEASEISSWAIDVRQVHTQTDVMDKNPTPTAPALPVAASIEDVISAMQNPDDWVIIDARSVDEFNGTQLMPGAYGTGRLKGAVNINQDDVRDAAGNLLGYEELTTLFEFIGDRSVIVYCHRGNRSATMWHILNSLDFNAYNFEGSWVYWSRAATGIGDLPSKLILSLTEDWTRVARRIF